MKKFLIITKSGSVYRLLYFGNSVSKHSNIHLVPVAGVSMSAGIYPVAKLTKNSDIYGDGGLYGHYYDDDKKGCVIPQKLIKHAVGKYIVLLNGGHTTTITEVYEEV